MNTIPETIHTCFAHPARLGDDDDVADDDERSLVRVGGPYGCVSTWRKDKTEAIYRFQEVVTKAVKERLTVSGH